jgi:hypothetical protein
MTIINFEDLTADEHKVIERHSDGYHHHAEFWTGFADFQHDRSRRNPWDEDSNAAEAWDHGWEAAWRTILHRKPHYEWTVYDLDDISTLAMIEGLRSVAKKRPHLVVDNTE